VAELAAWDRFVGGEQGQAGLVDVLLLSPSVNVEVLLRRVSLPADVIMIAVRWCPRYGLSYRDVERDVEELLAERGITVDHVSIYHWAQRFTPLLIGAARPCRHVPGDRWFADETQVKAAGRWVCLYRAIGQYGQVVDVLVSGKRDLAATRRFFTQALDHGTPGWPSVRTAAASPGTCLSCDPPNPHVTHLGRSMYSP
jgi:IS6 family transposase